MGDSFIPQLGIVKKGLAGDATPVQADATKAISFDNGGLHAQLGCTNGSNIASGPTSDDDEIVML